MRIRFKYILWFVLSCSVTSVISQHAIDFPFTELEERSHSLEVRAEFDYFSDHVQNSLVTNSIFGGFSDRNSLKDMVSDMDGYNTVGGWFDAGLRYRAFSDSVKMKKNRSIFLEFGTAGFGFTAFPKDVFHLTFLGNADRLGETMNLSGLNSAYMTYQYAGLGLMNESTGSYISFNLINVQDYFSTEVDELTLFTAADATELALDYNGSVMLSDTSAAGFLVNSGTGLALNARYNVQMPSNNDIFSIELRNVGASLLNERTLHLEADSSWQFTGVAIEDLFSSDNPLSTITLEDSVSYSSEQERQLILMPSDLRSTYYHSINSKDHLAFSLGKRFFSEHRAELGFNYLHRESEKIGYNIGISYGGYGGFRVNAGGYLYLKNWSFFLTTQNLTGAFLDSAHGRSASIGITKSFRNT